MLVEAFHPVTPSAPPIRIQGPAGGGGCFLWIQADIIAATKPFMVERGPISAFTAPNAYLDAMPKEPFEPFTFSPGAAAVHQLGPFGTAAKKLKEWDLKP